VRIRIRRPPQATRLEDFDLRPYQFEEGKIYDVAQRLGETLVLYEYAEIEMRQRRRSSASACDERRSNHREDVAVAQIDDADDVEPA
jgi:hypothetical protein